MPPSESQPSELREALKQLIPLMTQRIEYAEARRNSIVVVAGSATALGAALFAVLPSSSDHPEIFWGLAVFASLLLLGGALTILVYLKQTNYRYPFTESTNSYKWFYRNALQDEAIYSFGWSRYLWDRDEVRELQKTKYEEGWSKFERTIQKLNTAVENDEQDVRQVYLLHVNEATKNVFLTQLRKTLARSILVAICSGFLASGIAAAFLNPAFGSASCVSSGATVNTRWRRTNVRSCHDGGVCFSNYLVDATVRNTGKTALRIQGFRVHDDVGFLLPAEVTSMTSADVIAPGSELRTSALVRIAPELADHLGLVEVEFAPNE